MTAEAAFLAVRHSGFRRGRLQTEWPLARRGAAANFGLVCAEREQAGRGPPRIETMEKNLTFQSLLLLTLLAVAVPLVIRQIQRVVRLPIVVGEILAGILVGQSGLNLIHETPVLTFLADFGFIFLMFLSGLELKFDVLLTSSSGREKASFWRRPAGLAGLNFALTLALALAGGFLLWKAGMTRNPILIGLILSTT